MYVRYNQNCIHAEFSCVSRIIPVVNGIISTEVSIFCTCNSLKCNMKINTLHLSHGKINLASYIHGTFDNVSGMRRWPLWLIANFALPKIHLK